MKLRVRLNRQTSKVELLGEEPSVTDLKVLIREMVLSSHGFSADTEFNLSLNGTEPLSDAGQTLSSCGIISGDLICVILHQSIAIASSSSIHQTSNSKATQWQMQYKTRQTAPMISNEQSASNPAAPRESEDNREVEEQGAGVSSWEPMLCCEVEEDQAPLSLEVLHHGAQSRSPSDSVMVAVHLLMLETGFTPHGAELKPGEMPTQWRAAGGVYRLHYTHPLCENVLVMVVSVSMGPLLVINATLKRNETVDTVRKLSLSPSSYVTDEYQGESAAAAYRDLGKLSRIFKDQLAYPLIAAAREAMALPEAFGLGALPPELLLRILRLLDVQSLVVLSSVSRRFHGITADSSLWRHLYHRDFSDQDHNRSRDTNWKDLYQRKYQLRNNRRRMPYLPTRSPNPLYPGPFPRFPPGMIGGEYDERPNIPRGILPPPRFNPIGPLPGHGPGRGGLFGWRGLRPRGNRSADIRRGFFY